MDSVKRPYRKTPIVCHSCGQEKKHFAKGLCKSCYKRAHASYYYQKHKERLKAQHRHQHQNREIIICIDCGQEKTSFARNMCSACYKRRYYWENRDKALAYKRQWLQEHPEKQSIYSRRCYRKNRERVLEREREWRKRNPEKMAAKRARYSARKRNAPDTLTTRRAEELLKIGRAVYPGEKLALDHFVPLTRGGGTTPGNIHAIPRALNIFKSNRLPQEVYKQLGLESICV